MEKKLISEKLRRVSLVIALIGWLAESFILAAPFWRNTSPWGSAQIVANIWVFEGLFLTCQQTYSLQGTNQCFQLQTFGSGMYRYSGGGGYFRPPGVSSKYSSSREFPLPGCGFRDTYLFAFCPSRTVAYPSRTIDNRVRRATCRKMKFISVKLRRAALVLALLSTIVMGFVLIAPYWRSTSPYSVTTIVTRNWMFEGLFLTCLSQGRGYSQCQQLPATSGMNGNYNSGYVGYIYSYLNAFRAMMIIAFIASLAGVVCSLLGMRCAKVMEEESNAKRWVIIVGGVCHIAAGTLTGISVSWYAAEVVREYYDPFYQSQKLRYTLGACLYIGWVATLLSLIAGCLMACCTCFGKPAADNYQPAKQQFSYPTAAMPAATYREEKPYKSDYYHSSTSRQPAYHSGRHSSRHHTHHSSRHYRDSSFDSSSHGDEKSYRGGSRHDSDLVRASGFV